MRKISSKKKIISLFVAVIAVIGAFIYTKSSLANANSDQDQANASVNLNVEKVDKDTVKISLDNLVPVVKSLQLGVKIDGDVTFAEDTIKWLVSSDDKDLKSNVKISSDKKSMDIFVVSTEALDKEAGKLEILEIDMNKVEGGSLKYKITPSSDENGIAYSYLLNDTNKQVSGNDIVNIDNNILTLNSAPKLVLANHPSVIEGKIVISKDDNFEPLDYVIATDDEEGEIDKSRINVTKNEVKTDKVGSYNISYSVEDSEGEVATLDTTVIVEAKPTADVQKPVIKATNKTINTTLGEEVDLLEGVSALDYLGREIQVEVSGDYDFNKAGTYTIQYNATDRFGNKADEVTATLVVEEKPEVPVEPEKPEIPGEPENPGNPGNPSEPDVPEVPENPEKPEISLPDDIINVGGNGTEESPMTYETENIVSLNKFVEQAQNKFKAVVTSRTILANGTQKYSIRLEEKGIIARLFGRTNTYYIDIIVPNTDEFNNVFSKLDKDDKEAPVIEYNGQLNITLENGANFEVPEVTAKDNLDIDVTVKVVIMDSNGKVIEKIDTTKSGKYTITYTAEDESGNKAKELVITVIVNEINVDSQPPVDENKPGTPVNPEIPGQSENTEKPSEGSNGLDNSGKNDLPTTGQGVYFGITIIIGIIIIGSGIFMFSKKKK
ncbi:DUF5011 domain-containing protein [Clostridium sp. NSJ-145]|uniref:immunoglobulin-like domain-containing protein n=1 Tax=Clostridium sp. NSJ-145 TaxID=2897777 RepID=UPI001E35E3AC|nr:immunoglobulin-like domain-containing protein [Clostridium sp. NSJ-145]MCD2502338.1 DUF5011 domain-containing protein [Clostridium sp. NSJ-145]